MNSVLVQVPVTIKAKLTEKLKARMLDDLNRNIGQAERDIQQIGADQDKALAEQGDTPQREASIRRYFGQEIGKRQNFLAEANARKDHLERLAIGAEIIQGTLQREVELTVGSDMREVMNVEVLVEDDKIVAIRS